MLDGSDSVNRGKNNDAGPPSRWLNRTVIGLGLASLFSDWSHEIATAALPAFLATLGVAAAWLGLKVRVEANGG